MAIGFKQNPDGSWQSYPKEDKKNPKAKTPIESKSEEPVKKPTAKKKV